MAPGYLELEQGVRAQGVRTLRTTTAWDVNLKVGLRGNLQLGLFGTAFVRTGAGAGLGDLGVALKIRADVSPATALAVVPSVTLPSGDAAQGRGAGRALGGVVVVASADLPGRLHVDVNLGPTGVGAGSAQWFHSVSGSWGSGRYGVTGELYGWTAGAGQGAVWGVLGAVTVRVVTWAVVDAGGSVGMSGQTPDLVFAGVTTNLGRIFK